MASVDELVTELKKLRPEQVDAVAKIVHNLSETVGQELPLHSRMPGRIVDEAVRHGWPADLFTDLIGSLPELERATQPPADDRASL